MGRGNNFPVGLEGALKLKEISYIHAEGYPAAELKHGPIALVDEGVPVVALAPSDDLFSKTASNIDELRVHLDTLFNFASQVSYTQNHLLPVIQAGKSLIGIKPEDPPKNLLKWLEEYVKKFSLKKGKI